MITIPAERHLVRIRRSIPHADPIEGFVLDVSESWTLLARCVDLRLDGWTAVRTADITRVKRLGGGDSMTVRVLDACWIGAPVGFGRKTLRLHEVDLDAEWHDAPRKHRLKDLTRIDCGGHYVETLREFAGAVPTPA
ncbi:hypothetical protein ACFXJ5_29275 [Streptomyces sp. NPDC059373]